MDSLVLTIQKILVIDWLTYFQNILLFLRRKPLFGRVCLRHELYNVRELRVGV